MPAEVKPARQVGLDALRGLAMVIMALDHVREFFHSGAQAFQPDDLARTTTAIFMTRWITHFCAPVFMLTAGASAWLWQRRAGASPAELSAFLLKRGLWLVVLDLTVLRFGMNFTGQVPVVILNVLWALGWSMVVLAGISRLPRGAILGLCAAVIGLHNLTDGVQAGWWWTVLHQPAVLRLGLYTIISGYSLIPWFAVMGLGFGIGPWFERRGRRFLWSGLAACAGFLALRGWNVYGDPSPWTGSVLSFLRATKYPPSLEFLLMTLGPALVLLAWLKVRGGRGLGVLVTFGRVPLFYFLGHFYLAHILDRSSLVYFWQVSTQQ